MLIIEPKKLVKTISRRELAKKIDHTLLKPNVTLSQLEKTCIESRNYGFAACVIPAFFVERAVKLLKESDVKVATVIGFPHGNLTTKAKLADTREVLEKGAREIDMVLNISALKSGLYDFVKREIREIVDLAKDYDAVIKVIIETAYLTDDEKVKAAVIVKEAGAHYVKTSTGFAGVGATVHDVLLLKRAVGEFPKIKAAGGIRHLEDALIMIFAGAERIGTSSGVRIMEEYDKLVNSLK